MAQLSLVLAWIPTWTQGEEAQGERALWSLSSWESAHKLALAWVQEADDASSVSSPSPSGQSSSTNPGPTARGQSSP